MSFVDDTIVWRLCLLLQAGHFCAVDNESYGDNRQIKVDLAFVYFYPLRKYAKHLEDRLSARKDN